MTKYKCKNCGKVFTVEPLAYLDLTSMDTEFFCSRYCAENPRLKADVKPEKKPVQPVQLRLF